MNYKSFISPSILQVGYRFEYAGKSVSKSYLFQGTREESMQFIKHKINKEPKWLSDQVNLDPSSDNPNKVFISEVFINGTSS